MNSLSPGWHITSVNWHIKKFFQRLHGAKTCCAFTGGNYKRSKRRAVLPAKGFSSLHPKFHTASCAQWAKFSWIP